MGSKPPFGYTKSPDNKHKLEIDPVAARIVERVFREFANGESGRNIAAKLNAEGIDTPNTYYFKLTGKRATRGDSCPKWGSKTIIQMLNNQAYIGNMAQGKCKVASFKTKKRIENSPDDWVVVEHTHEPIIDGYTWERAQRRLEETQSAASNHSVRINSTDEVNLFSGMIRCADCGAVMAFNRKTRKGGGEKRFYRCSRYANNGKDTCSTHTIDEEVLEAVLLHEIRHHAKTAVQDEGRLLDRLLAYSDEAAKSESAAKEKALRDAEGRISFIESAGKKLFEERVMGNVPENLFRKMLADYQRELDELSEKAAGLRRHMQDKRNDRADAQRWLNLIKECASIDKIDRATVCNLIDSLEVHEECDECGIRTQSVQVNYNFVGNIH
jgi:hypothetical protein